VLNVFLALAPALAYIGCIGEPDGAVLVLGEFGLHLQDLRLVHLLHVVADVVTLQ